MEIHLKTRCRAIPSSRFVIEHTVEGTSICDVASGLDLCHSPSCCKSRRTVRTDICNLQTNPFLYSWHGCTIHFGHPDKMSVFMASNDSGSLRSSRTFHMTLLNLSISFSAGSNEISTGASSDTISPISVGYNSTSIKIRHIVARISFSYLRHHNNFLPDSSAQVQHVFEKLSKQLFLFRRIVGIATTTYFSWMR